MLDKLKADDSKTRMAALNEVAKQGPTAAFAVPLLVTVYLDSRDSVIGQAIGALAAFGPAAREAIPGIRQLRDDPDALPIVRDMAVGSAYADPERPGCDGRPRPSRGRGVDAADNTPPVESAEK